MVSRRNFLNIITMMAVLFFMFVFTQVIKETGNNYDVNEHVVSAEKLPKGTSAWTQEQSNIEYPDKEYILFLGDANSELYEIVQQWCTYTKRIMVQEDSLSGFSKVDENLEMILLDTTDLDLKKDKSQLLKIVQSGASVVFCNLPSASEIAGAKYLQEILGIREIREEETEILGINLYEGFFLGGGAVYEPKESEDYKRMDLELVVPWFITGGGTKTYMVGIKDKEQVEREEFPSLVWRNAYDGTMVFAIEGEFMSSVVGLGFLDAIAYEADSYELYPVVNAQNVIVANFPGFTSENSEKIMELYSRSPQNTYRDIMWPSIAAMVKTNDLKLTCLFNPQFDYSDGVLPEAEEMVFYLQQLKELRSEAGMSLKYKENVDLAEVLEQDRIFYEERNSEYAYQVAYVENKDIESIENGIGKNGVFRNLRTITCKPEIDTPVLSYLKNDITLQCVTGTAVQHSYMDNLKAKSLQTALGYSNVLLDLHPAIWPQDTVDEWQHLYDDMSSNVSTYWSGEYNFEQTTLSESDFRVRNLLNLDFSDVRNGSSIVLRVSNFEEEAWFLLRTHDEKIVEIQGGEYERLERNAYLIKVIDEEVIIDLSPLSLKEMSTGEE